ncbi:MAG: hypothetical protein EOO25_17505 [Comamonadaceae bacterium]|nr:MAG: hypothetical protein EOO25_17505 [Comamonadaceae bacterium]
MTQYQPINLSRWIAGGAACVVALAIAAYLLVDIGGQARERTQPLPAAQPQAPVAKPAREEQIITEMREELLPPSPTSRKPEWAAPPQRAAGNRRLAASAPPAPAAAAAPEPAREVQARPAASVPAARAAPAELCAGQSGIGQSICLARQCSDAAWRGHRLCQQVREAEQKMRERYEQGG